MVCGVGWLPFVFCCVIFVHRRWHQALYVLFWSNTIPGTLNLLKEELMWCDDDGDAIC